ncbi:MAG: hypothetical protein U5R31_13720 [Acidimicrobiia bacterium]|nr:hypothetical protein [Acidimicrobiia bacterium]
MTDLSWLRARLDALGDADRAEVDRELRRWALRRAVDDDEQAAEVIGGMASAVATGRTGALRVALAPLGDRQAEDLARAMLRVAHRLADAGRPGPADALVALAGAVGDVAASQRGTLEDLEERGRLVSADEVADLLAGADEIRAFGLELHHSH